MEMPEFDKYRYVVVKHDDSVRFDAWWILAKGRLAAADRAEFDSLAGVLERVEAPERIGLNYSDPHLLKIYRTLRVI
jgi:hypothetical protein